MLILFLLMGIASFLYFAFLWTTTALSDIWIWLIIGLLHLFLSFLYRKKAKWKRNSFLFRAKVFCLSTYCIFIALFFALSFFLSRYKFGKAENNLDYVLVLGCELEDNRPSQTLKKRLELAVNYAEENPNTRFVLVGGRGKYSASAESSVMYHALLRSGIAGDRLLMEFYSKNTKEKIQFGLNSIAEWREELYFRDMELQREKGLDFQDEEYSYIKEDALEWEDRPPHVGILSSQYQLFHCMAFAKEEQEYYFVTMSSEEPLYLIPHYYTREVLSLLLGRLFHQI